MKLLLMLITLCWLPFANISVNNYHFSGNSKVTIAGTSTMHDWTMDSRTLKGEATMEISDNKILSIKEVRVEIPVESLKSGKSAMDKNAYEALKSGKNPTILFQLKDFDQVKLTNGKSALEVTGNLTIAGKTRTEKIQVEYSTDKMGNLLMKGSKNIKMTDYGVTPPEVMFGTIKTGNDLSINFDLQLVQRSI